MDAHTCDSLRHAIEALVGGRFDDLTPAQADAAAAHLDDCAACRARVAAAPAIPQAPLEPDSARPAAEVLERMWPEIDEAVGAGSRTVRGRRPRRTLRSWVTLATAAALTLAVTLWLLQPQAAACWDLNLAGRGDIDIESLEVHGADTLVVMATGDIEGTAIIWIVEDEEELQ